MTPPSPYRFPTAATRSSAAIFTAIATALIIAFSAFWRAVPSKPIATLLLDPRVMVAMAMYFYASRLTATAAKTPPPSANSNCSTGSPSTNSDVNAGKRHQTPPPPPPSSMTTTTATNEKVRYWICTRDSFRNVSWQETFSPNPYRCMTSLCL